MDATFDRDDDRDGDRRRRALAPAPRQSPEDRRSGALTVTARTEPFREQPGDAFELDFRHYLDVLLKHRLLVGGAIIASLVLGLLVTLLTTPLYQSVARLKIDPQTLNVINVEGFNRPSYANNREDFATAQQLLGSRALADRVVADMGLAENPGFLGTERLSISRALGNLFGESEPSSEEKALARREAAIRLVMKGVTSQVVGRSRLIDVRFHHTSPQIAMMVANGVADGFINSTLDRRYDASTYARTFLEERIEQLKARLEESERELVVHAGEQGIVNLDDRQSIASANLAKANDELLTARNERIRNEALWKQVQASGGETIPPQINNAELTTNRENRTTLSAEYSERLGLFKPSYPDMQRLRAQINELDRLAVQAVRDLYEASLAQEQELEKQLEIARNEILELRNRSIQYNILQREVDTNRTLYDGLLQRYKEIGLAGGVGLNNVAIVDRALVPTAPYRPNLSQNLMLALVLGVVVGVGIAFALDYLDDTVKRPEDLETLVDMPALGLIPEIDGDVDALLNNTRSPIAEAFRSLQTALQFSTPRGVPQTLTITSTGQSEGKSTTSQAIARKFGSIGQRVLLIDADMRNPSLHRRLGLGNSLGLSTYLSGARCLRDVIQQTGFKNVDIITSGPLPPNPAELLSSSRLPDLIEITGDEYDLIVIDSAPVLGLADAPILSSICDGTILVVSAGNTRKPMLRIAVRRLHQANAYLIGAVLNRFRSEQAGYGYGYGYGYEYGAYTVYPDTGTQALPWYRQLPFTRTGKG